MKLDRLLGITMELLTKKRVTAAELASKFEENPQNHLLNGF
jgi:predicted DNA-binding transcriptional regulator YafY